MTSSSLSYNGFVEYEEYFTKLHFLRWRVFHVFQPRLDHLGYYIDDQSNTLQNDIFEFLANSESRWYASSSKIIVSSFTVAIENKDIQFEFKLRFGDNIKLN